MAKKKREKVKPQPTKRQLSRWERQRRMQRITFASGVFVMAVVVGMVAFGWYINNYRPMREPVLSVNNMKFDMGYYLPVLQAYVGSPEYPSMNPALADQALASIERSEKVRQAAAKMGFTVSDKDVTPEIEKQGLPLTQAFRDLVRTQLIYTKLKDNHFAKDIPTTAPQRQAMAMFLESKSQADDIAAQLAKGGDFGTLAAASSLDSPTKTKSGDLGWAPKGILNQVLGSTVVEETVFSHKISTVSDPIYDEVKIKTVGYLLVKILEKSETQLHPASMLLGSMEEAQNVRVQLVAGADFAALAKQYSQESSSAAQGGDLGWLDNARVPAVFASFANSATSGALSEPIKDTGASTKGGYWLIKVTAEDANREVSADHITAMKSRALTDWIKSVDDDKSMVVNNYLDEEKKTWALQYVATHPK